MAPLPEPCCGQPETCKEVCIHNFFHRDAKARQEGKNLDGSDRREATPAGGIALNPKDLAGRSKPQLGLIPTSAMVPVARVMELGARKYGPYNWRYTPIGLMTYLHAMKRHIEDVINGIDTDPESGEPHLAHVASGAMIVLDAQAKGTLREDRPTVVEIKPEPKKA